jgi:hypothetical protein
MIRKTANLFKKTLLLLLLICALNTANSILKVNANPTTTVSILPPTVTINAPGENVTVDLNITDVTNLYGYEIMIWYSNSILNATSAVRPPGHFMEPTDPAKQFIPKWEIKNNYNATHGRIWLGFTLLAPEAPKSGSGILARITFQGLSIGTTQIKILYPGYQYPAKLADNTGAPIPNTAQDGEIIVIPEFPSMVIPLILVLPFTAAYTLKTIRAKRKQ